MSVIEAMNRVYAQFASAGVTRADIVQLAGVLGTVRCPGGPSIPFSIGRKDSDTLDKASLLPGDTEPAPVLIARFERMGFSASELIALIGSHTSAKKFTQNPRAQLVDQTGISLDSTPEVWDVTYYGEIHNKPGAEDTHLVSDVNLANYKDTSGEFAHFVNNQNDWNNKFSAAMVKMANLGYHESSLTRCPIVPAATPLPGSRN
ncbi:heme peroxidase [Geranomyces variabilis]|nr:heme peroxidase [Geranomyces variabilis]